tara:strand:- start:49713 stop:50324 length:612 start_codon:yes stop_codon:yes gene_type:complete
MVRQTDLLENLSEAVNTNQISSFVDIDGQQRNIRWVETQLDELDIEIALQHFNNAVSKVEKMKELAKNIRGNEMAKAVVTFKVNERAAKLANILTKQLVENNNWFTSVKQHVAWVVRLGFEERAREAYLDARGSLIRTRTRYVHILSNNSASITNTNTTPGNASSKAICLSTSSKYPLSTSPSSRIASTCSRNAFPNNSCPRA